MTYFSRVLRQMSTMSQAMRSKPHGPATHTLTTIAADMTIQRMGCSLLASGVCC